MATSIAQESGTSSGSIIAGYFASGEDAHRAINALLDEGFLPSQIGAAFHSGGAAASGGRTGSRAVLGGDTMRQELGTTITTESDADSSAGGPSSDDFAVQPVGLATGSGSPILGAGRPGPISGSSLENTGLPSELKHELPRDKEGSSSQAGYATTPAPPAHLVPASQHHLQPAGQSWTAKLKHLFTGEPATAPAAASSATTTAESQNFGSGTGSLGFDPIFGRPYVVSEFERSVAGAGVTPEHSQQLSRRLSGGGAVVTVSSTGRAIEVEKIFERHHGHVRFASGMFEDAPNMRGSAHVEVFGHLEHIYPGGALVAETSRRKAKGPAHGGRAFLRGCCRARVIYKQVRRAGALRA